MARLPDILNPEMDMDTDLDHTKYRDLLPLNDAMNEIGAGIMDMIKKALNPELEQAILKIVPLGP